MKTTTLGTLVRAFAAIWLVASPATANTGANVKCWAPHLGSSHILLDSHGMGVGTYAGRPYSYNIYGVAGNIALGDQCDGAFPDPNDPQRRFRQGWWIGGLGDRVDIVSGVKLQVNWAQYYPERLTVTGDRPGAASGPVRKLGEVWNVREKFGYQEVTLVFHLYGSQDSAIPNRNPSGHFYVVGEYLTGPPKLSGKLDVTKDAILRGNVTNVGYKIDRKGGSPATPPFTDYDPNGEVTFLSSSH